MNAKWGIQQRLVRAFLLQALLISITAVIGVYAAGIMIREVLVTRALQEEANYFWDQRVRNPAFTLPHTLNLTGYLDSGTVGRRNTWRPSDPVIMISPARLISVLCMSLSRMVKNCICYLMVSR